MRLFLVRHAESANNRAWAERGDDSGRVPDPSLTDLGERQADALADWVRADRGRLPATVLYTSLAIRCVQTAAPLADVLNLPLNGHEHLVEVPGLFERDPDSEERVAYAGAGAHELRELSPRLQLPASARSDGWWSGPVEDSAASLARAARVIDHISTHDDDAVIAMVTHGAFTQYLLPALMGGTLAIHGWYTINNTGVSEIELSHGSEFGGEGRTPLHALVHSLNRLDHLRPDQVSN